MSQGNPIGAQVAVPAMPGSPVKRAFSSRAFLVAVIIMAVVGIGMQFMTTFMQVYFKKEPVAMRALLDTVPDQMGPWYKVSLDEPLPKDIEDALGTKEYIFRAYIDSRVVGMDKVNELLKMPSEQRGREVSQIEHRYPRSIVHFAVTYYTGMVDTVAHIPDRCYIADGYEPSEYKVEAWKLNDGRQVEVRYINFEDATGFASKATKNVAYFFQVNGAMESDPLGVRRRLQNLFNRQGYYAKIELMTLDPDRDESASVMRDFLVLGLREAQKCLPAIPGEATSQPSQPQTRPVSVDADRAADSDGSVTADK